MELSPGKLRALFVLLVIALAALGIYLIGPGRDHGAGAAPAPSAASPASPAGAASLVPPTLVPTTAPLPTAIPASAKSVNIYDWLPFSQQDLAVAASVTLKFAGAYETFSYTETPAAYLTRLASVVTPELGQTLERGYETPGVAQQRAKTREVSKSSGGIAQINSFGSGSITFIINVAQQTATTTGTSSTTSQFAVTVVQQGGGWEVNDIEPAQNGQPAGNP